MAYGDYMGGMGGMGRPAKGAAPYRDYFDPSKGETAYDVGPPTIPNLDEGNNDPTKGTLPGQDPGAIGIGPNQNQYPIMDQTGRGSNYGGPRRGGYGQQGGTGRGPFGDGRGGYGGQQGGYGGGNPYQMQNPFMGGGMGGYGQQGGYGGGMGGYGGQQMQNPFMGYQGGAI